MSAQIEKETAMNTLEIDREVIRCKTCGLVQYRTRTGNCRRCVHALPQRLEYLIPEEAVKEEQAPAEVMASKFANQETVENIGQRIRQLRESRSHDAEPASGQVQGQPLLSFAHRERADDAKPRDTGEDFRSAQRRLNRFFIPESDGEALLEDPFIQGLRPFLRQLDWEQWQSILKRLQAISDHVNAAPITLRPIGNPARLPQPAPANGNGQNGHIGHASHSNGLVPAHAHGQPQGYPLRRPGLPAFQRPLAR